MSATSRFVTLISTICQNAKHVGEVSKGLGLVVVLYSGKSSSKMA